MFSNDFLQVIRVQVLEEKEKDSIEYLMRKTTKRKCTWTDLGRFYLHKQAQNAQNAQRP